MKKLFLSLCAIAGLCVNAGAVEYDILQTWDMIKIYKDNGYSDKTVPETSGVSILGYEAVAILDNKVALNDRGKWMFRPGGLYQGTGGGRDVAFASLKKDDLIELYVGAVDITAKTNCEKVEADVEGTVLFKVNEDGDVSVNSPRYTCYTKIVIKHAKAVSEDSKAMYTIKYMCGDDELKTSVTREGVVGDVPAITTADKNVIFNEDQSKKYGYVSYESNEAVLSASSTVITVKFAELAKYTFTAKTSNPEIVLASGAVWEDEDAAVYYPVYILKDDKTLSTKAAVNQEYRYYERLTADKEIVLPYTDTDIENVVFYVEAENIEGAAYSNSIANRCSNGAGASFAADVDLVTLPAGKYTITASTRGSGAKDWGYEFKVGEDVVYTTANLMGYNQTGTSEEIVLNEESTIVIVAKGDRNNVLDFVYIQKTGDVEPMTPTAVESIDAENSAKAYKVVENGKVVIVKGDQKFDLAGRKL